MGHIRRVSREVEVVVPVFMRGAWRGSTGGDRRRRRRLLRKPKLRINQAGAQAQMRALFVEMGSNLGQHDALGLHDTQLVFDGGQAMLIQLALQLQEATLLFYFR